MTGIIYLLVRSDRNVSTAEMVVKSYLHLSCLFILKLIETL